MTLELQNQILPALEADFGITTRLSGQAEQERAFLSDAAIGLGLCLVLIYLTLAWVFSSWMRPMVVMAVIPFGLIGVIYGHMSWDVAMSLFSIVGLMGMVGIIINDSIVLVTTVDQYARDRGLIPSIVDAACDRLRPVILTTLTTVLGLMPLLFEQSTQAKFLKPTVITLVYGLGFGMVIVLLLVPALLAIGHDVRRLFTSLSRSLTQPQSGLGQLPRLAVLAVAGWLAATLGWTVWQGVLPPPLAGLAAAFGGDPLRAALVLALGGTALGLATIWLAGALGVWVRQRGAAQRATEQP